MTIKEVCEKFDLTPDTLRYYERVGVIPEVNRTKGGILGSKNPLGVVLATVIGTPLYADTFGTISIAFS